jgi:transcriptional regulator with XRE-family HTH domain
LSVALSIKELGQKTRLTRTQIQQFEKDLLTPSSSQLINLARECNVRVEYYFRNQQIELLNLNFRQLKLLDTRTQDLIRYKIIGLIESRIELLRFVPYAPIHKFSESKELLGHIKSLDDLEKFFENHCKSIPLGIHPISYLNAQLEKFGILFIVVNEIHPRFLMITATAKSLEGIFYNILAISSQYLKNLIDTVFSNPSNEKINYSESHLDLFKHLVYKSLGDGLITESKAAELVGVPLMSFYQSNKRSARQD